MGTGGTESTVPGDDRDQAPFTGDRVGRYLLLREIGSGAMGRVYAGFDPDLDRGVAIKLVAGGDDRARELAPYFLREARTLAALSHPNIVPVFDVGQDADRLYIVMELVDGASLATWLAERPRTTREIVRAWCAAGRGLGAAHAAGVVHRDFKASNALIAADGRVRVADFGLARSREGDDSPKPVEGTRSHLAPEAARRGAATEAVDQYAFCVSLYHALAGAYPPDARRAIPRRVRGAIERGLEHDPAARWPSVSALVDALERTQRLPRALWVGGVAAVAALGGAWSIAAANRPDDECELASAVFERELGAARPTRLLGAVAETPRAAPFAPQVMRAFDDGVARWYTAYAADCATPARAACLVSRLGELALLIDHAIISSEPALVDAPIAIATWTDELATCTTAAPEPDESREYRLAMVRARVLSRTERTDDAVAAADVAIARARDPRAAIRAKLRRIEVEPDSDAATFAPLFAEARAIADPALHREAAGTFAEACLEIRGPCAREWTDRFAELVGTSSDHREAQAELIGLRGALAARDGNHPIAIAAYEDQLRKLEAVHGPHGQFLLAPLQRQVSSLLQVGRFADALRAAVRADAIAVWWAGEHHPFRAAALGNRAIPKLQLGDLAGATADFERAIALRLAFRGDDARSLHGLYNNLAGLYVAQGKPAQALELVDRALAIYDRHPELAAHFVHLAVHNGASIATELGRPDARARLDRAFALAKDRMASGHPTWAGLYGTRVVLHLRAGSLDEAAADLREALRLLRGRAGVAELDLAAADLLDAALALRRRRLDDVRRALDRVAPVAAAAGSAHPSSAAWRALEAELAILRGKPAVAREHLARIQLEHARSEPRLVAKVHLLSATLAGDQARAAADRDRALAVLRAAGIPGSAYEDCAACARPR